MPFFSLIPFQEIVLAFFLGLGAFLLLYLAWGSYPPGPGEAREEDRKEPEGSELGAYPQKAENPFPPFLVLVYAGVALWVLAYWIIIGLRVRAIG